MDVAVRLRNALFRALKEIRIAVEITKTLSFMHAWNVLVANILIWRIDKNKHMPKLYKYMSIVPL